MTSARTRTLCLAMPWSIAALASRGGASVAAVPRSSATSMSALRRR